jgi:hypothetical protein
MVLRIDRIPEQVAPLDNAAPAAPATPVAIFLHLIVVLSAERPEVR